jgi:hypothetical protein
VRGVNCSTCRFFQADGSGVTGLCRVAPPVTPQIRGNRVMAVGYWPTVYADDWCGSYTQRDDQIGSITA